MRCWFYLLNIVCILQLGSHPVYCEKESSQQIALNHLINEYQISGGSKGGREGRAPLPGDPNSFNFKQFLGKFGKIIFWCPPGELAPPPWGNPGSTTANYINYCLQMKFVKVMFLHLSVILFTGGCLPQCMLGYTPLPPRTRGRHPLEQRETTPRTRGRHPLDQRQTPPIGVDTPQDQRQTPPTADTPWDQRQTPPMSRHPQDQRQTPPRSRHPPWE